MSWRYDAYRIWLGGGHLYQIHVHVPVIEASLVWNFSVIRMELIIYPYLSLFIYRVT